jgi:hypothetical protein
MCYITWTKEQIFSVKRIIFCKRLKKIGGLPYGPRQPQRGIEGSKPVRWYIEHGWCKGICKTPINWDCPSRVARFINVTQAAPIVATRRRNRAAVQSPAMLPVTDRLRA